MPFFSLIRRIKREVLFILTIQVEKNPLVVFCVYHGARELGKCKVSKTVLVHCTDVSVLLERQCGETKLEFGIVR